jgi:hypothetical protein
VIGIPATTGVVAFGLASAVTLQACAMDPAPFRLPQHHLPAIAASAVATGGQIAFDGRCVWLDGDGADANLVWPNTFRAIALPLEIFGGSGRAIIHDGDSVELGVADGHAAIPGCPVRAVFLVGEISSVNGEAWPDGAPNLPPPGRPPGRPR